jgi:hypothetical protein
MPIGRQVKIISITGGASSGSATDIDAGHAWIVAIVGASSGSASACRLPAGAEIGDVVEIYTNGSQQTNIFAPDGESFLNTGTNPSIGSDDGGVFCRKISASVWVWNH